jgi:hypothetical protein
VTFLEKNTDPLIYETVTQWIGLSPGSEGWYVTLFPLLPFYSSFYLSYLALT